MKKLIPWTAASLLLFALLATAAGAASAQEAAGGAPVAENLELTTYRGVSVGGILSAVDPEGGKLTFEITTPPSKGSVELEEDGHFVYTPQANRRGRDYFGYRASDPEGNRSQEATVIIRLVKQRGGAAYTDMEGNDSAYAAALLSERGIFTGEQLAGEHVFCPDRSVTREEFLAMCMELTGTTLLRDISVTGFSDDSAIAAWAKPYVATALRNGLVLGYAEEGAAASFGAGRPVTAGEAAVLLDRALDLTDTAVIRDVYATAVPAWAQQSLSDLSACDMLPYGVSDSGEYLTRAQAAQMLASAAEVLDRR